MRDGGDRLDLVRRIKRARLAGLADRDRHRLAGMDEVRLEAGKLPLQPCRVDPPGRAVHRRHAGAMGEEFRRAAFVLDDMRFAMAQNDAARSVDGGESERVRGRARADEEDRDLAFEDLVEAALDRLVEIARAVGGGHARAVGGKRGVDRRVGPGPVVGSENHGGGLQRASAKGKLPENWEQGFSGTCADIESILLSGRTSAILRQIGQHCCHKYGRQAGSGGAQDGPKRRSRVLS